MAQVDATIYRINEHNLDVAQSKIKRALINQGKGADKYVSHFFSSSKEIYPRAYNNGGTLIGIKGSDASRFEANSSNPDGL